MDFGNQLEQQMALADQLEVQCKWEAAYKIYHECAIKAKNVIASC